MNDNNTKDDSEKPGKVRSPKYPIIGLKEAVAKAKKIWDKAGKNEVPINNLADYWDISRTSSALIGFTAALIKFGLIQSFSGSKSERQVKLTSLGIEILNHPEASNEREASLKKAALRPEIYAELWTKYQGELPDDTVIAPYLLIQKNFNKSAVSVFLRAFRETISFSKLDSRDMVDLRPPTEASVLSGGNRGLEPLPAATSQNLNIVRANESTVIRELPIPLEGGLTARIPYPLSEDDFKILLDTLDLWKRRIVRKLRDNSEEPQS